MRQIVAPNSGLTNQPNNPANPSASTPLLSYFLGDAIGSTVRLARADQTIQAEYKYDAYGQTTQATPSGQPASDNPYQYTGRENDAALPSGNGNGISVPTLYQYRYRYYSPTLSRFTQEDRVEFAGGPNLYAYVEGDPANLVDPDGNMPIGGQGAWSRVLKARCTSLDMQTCIGKCGSESKVERCVVRIVKKTYSFDPHTGGRVYDPKRLVDCECKDDEPPGMCRP